MKPLFYLTILFCLASCHSQQTLPDEISAILEREEPFTRFFETERACIIDPTSEGYLNARNTFFTQCYGAGRQQSSPKTQLQTLEKWLVDHHQIRPGKAEAMQNALWLAGMELLTDRPATPYETTGLRIERDIIYATQPNKDVRLDLFLPKSPSSQNIPCIICIHGGGFRVHRREWFAGHAATFAHAGFAAVTIDYRKAPGTQSRLESVQDAKAAVRWVRANAPRYGIDANQIGAFGGSAGAFLTNSLATTSGVVELENSGGNTHVSSSVQAAVPCAGSCMRLDTPAERAVDQSLQAAVKTYGRSMMEKFSPYEQVDSDDPPILLLHGDQDNVVPLWQSEDLRDRYRAVGAHATLEIIDGGKHTFYLSPKTVNRAVDFFRSVFESDV